MLSFGGLAACGEGSACDQACDKMSECVNISGAEVNCTFDDVECTGIYECIANCVVASSCNEIMTPPGTGTETNYSKCLMACAKKP